MNSDIFQPEKLLAAGPAAKVYRGVETETGRKVLIKVLLSEHEASHPLDREHLQLLATSLLHIRHPHIAGLLTMVPTEDEFALVYKFMPGISGRALPLEKKTTTADIRALAVQLMHALLVGEHLRQPHGDLKPSNLIIADHPSGGLFLHVQDWGLSLARAQPNAESLWFRAPELQRGGALSVQSDLFTAAATLFYLATGAAPAQGSTPEEVLADLASFDLRGSLMLMRPDFDAALVDWLAWLLQPAPELRPQTVTLALDVLMRSMQSGFVYQDEPAPQMAPGAVTGPLVIGPSTNAIPRAPRPAPKTAGPSTSLLTKAPTALPPQPRERTAAIEAPKKKGSSLRLLFAVFLNLVALGALVYFFVPGIKNGGWREWFAAKKQTAPPETAATALTAVPAPAPSTAEGPGVKGRYVRIFMKGKGVISLAEVQIFSGTENIAFQGTATQSSEQSDGKPDRAIDGNTDGSKDSKSVSHTHGNDKDPRWQLDLGRELVLNTIVIWNRTDDEKYVNRLKDFTVQILSAHQSVVWETTVKEVPKPRVKLVPGAEP